MNHSLPSFKHPPLSEVSIGIQFEPLDRMRIPHFGSLWECFRKEFPLVEHAPPIFKDGAFEVDKTSGLPLPRVWFINQIETRVIQLQVNRYNFNWRTREDAEAYPRFPEIKASFLRYLSVLEEFLAKADIGLIKPMVTELSYINTFKHGKEIDSSNDTSRIFRDFCWQKQDDRFLPKPTSLNWDVSFPIVGDQGALKVRLTHVKRLTDLKVVPQLELAASRRIPAGETLATTQSWYDLAHDWIVRGFADLTTTEAQENHWGLDHEPK